MKVSVYVGMSLDGFIARQDGDIEWLTVFQNKEVEDSYKEFIRTIDTIVIGKRTFEKVLGFPSWPYDRNVFVLSSTMKKLPPEAIGKATLVSMKPSALLMYLSNEGFSNIYVDGGNTVRRFLENDLVGELIVTQVPILIGSGLPLFGPLNKDLQFNHISTNVYSNGLVKSHYERTRK